MTALRERCEPRVVAALWRQVAPEQATNSTAIAMGLCAHPHASSSRGAPSSAKAGTDAAAFIPVKQACLGFNWLTSRGLEWVPTRHDLVGQHAVPDRWST